MKTDIHVWPAKEEHVASEDCECKPERDVMAPVVVAHNALGGRFDLKTVEKETKK